MALDKVNYIDGETVIGAKNLNEIQEEIIKNGADIKKNGDDLALLKAQVSTLVNATVE